VAPAASGAHTATPKANAHTQALNHVVTIGDPNEMGPVQ
jgi:hypothetical protein